MVFERSLVTKIPKEKRASLDARGLSNPGGDRPPAVRLPERKPAGCVRLGNPSPQ